ncbi:hypothetical protein EYC84_002572 [Monilinia fructicola]|uniref:Uncharacterized protein n=1 Tax=Monilinia fructicola TaxID=38448 RepID=A0A5M9JLX6_MONFR|nr:hypothetical protein EYC84_002572 [Monilinia fructicola]
MGVWGKGCISVFSTVLWCFEKGTKRGFEIEEMIMVNVTRWDLYCIFGVFFFPIGIRHLAHAYFERDFALGCG